VAGIEIRFSEDNRSQAEWDRLVNEGSSIGAVEASTAWLRNAPFWFRDARRSQTRVIRQADGHGPVTPSSLGGWLFDQAHDIFAGIAGLGLETIGTGLDMLGDAFLR
jgi:hypothetical protein